MRKLLFAVGIVFLSMNFVNMAGAQFSVSIGTSYSWSDGCYDFHGPIYYSGTNYRGFCGDRPVRRYMVCRPALVYRCEPALIVQPVYVPVVRNTMVLRDVVYYPRSHRGFRDPLPYCPQSNGGVSEQSSRRVVIYR